jgi:5-methylcytosine-specific restriction endonuclease McrA
MQRVFVLDKKKQPLMPCTPARARKLLSKQKAVVYRHYPFTIILKERDGGDCQEIQHKIDQGSKTTGIALVADFKRGKTVIFAANLNHRGHSISQKLQARAAIRRSRRARNTRYRKPKWTNDMSQKQYAHINQRSKGWLAPSNLSRIDNIINLVHKLQKLVPLTHISVEDVRFDTQLMNNPDIQGKEYQQGTLFETEVKEYLLVLYHHQCAYCGGLSNDTILQKEHIVPRSKNGSNRISNLALACYTCNQEKDNLLPEKWLKQLSKSQSKINQERFKRFSKIAKGIKPSMRDAAAMNTIRKELVKQLSDFGLPVELGSGGLTKFNRTNQHYVKEHWIDAACIGESGEKVIISSKMMPLNIKAMGHGSRQMCRMDKYGFPRTAAKSTMSINGFKTGDLVKAIVTKGKNQGTHTGRVAVRTSGYFNITIQNGILQGISYRDCRLLQQKDGYQYSNLYDKIKNNKTTNVPFPPRAEARGFQDTK